MAQEITDKFVAARGGDREAMQEVFQIVYDHLYVMARRELGRRRVPATMGSTALVHEAYLKLIDAARADFQDRNHFFAVAAKAMRQILVDHARARIAVKRGAGARHVTFEEGQIGLEDRLVDVLMLDEALDQLEALNERLAKVVELRFFAGLSVEETAEITGTTPRTVKRDWRKARAFLFDALSDEANEGA